MFHGTLIRKFEFNSRNSRVIRTAALVATLVTGVFWTAQASADITVIVSSDSHDRYDRHHHHDRYNHASLVGSLLMPGSVRYHNIGHSRHDRHHRHDRHKHHGRYDRPRHPHARHSHHREFNSGNRGRWDSNRHREIIYVEKDARHRGNYRDVERRSVIIRRRDR